MSKGFTPLIGLAVVVALALAAVFGAMAIANPAQAQTQASPLTMYTGTTYSAYHGSAYAVYPAAVTASNINTAYVPSGIVSGNVIAAGTVDFSVNANAAVGIDGTLVEATFTDNKGTGSTTDDVETVVYIKVERSTVTSAKTGDALTVPLYIEHKQTIDLSKFYTAAETGAGVIASYSISDVSSETAYTASPNSGAVTGGMLDLTGNTELTTANTDLVVTATLKGQNDPAQGSTSASTVDATLSITVATSQLPSKTGVPIPSQDVEIGSPTTVSNATLLSSYRDGTGSGAIKGFAFVSNNPSVATVNATGTELTITPVKTGEATVSVTALHDNTGSADLTVNLNVRVVAAAVSPPTKVVAPMFTADSDSPGGTTSYEVKFGVAIDAKNDVSVNTRNDDLIIEFNGDYTIPASMSNTSVAVTTKYSTAPSVTFIPENVTVDGSEVYISLGDMDERDDMFDYILDEGETVTVLFRQAAGIKNPTAADDYGDAIVAIKFGAGVDIDNGDGDIAGLAETVVHKISIDPEDGGLGTTVTVTGKGFKNGTTMTAFRDRTNNGALGLDDNGLCVDNDIEGNVGSCTFVVTHPTFTAGATNHIDVVDGVNAYASASKVFELKASVTASPAGGSPGEIILVQVVDFTGDINKVTIGGEIWCGGKDPAGVSRNCTGSVDTDGNGNFPLKIPNWVRAGAQELKVYDVNGKNGKTTITLLGPQILVTPGTVLANQRISLVGTGFSPSAVIANADDPLGTVLPVIMIGGKKIDEDRINESDPVRVDSGGNWSASVDLPLTSATTSEGQRGIRVTDSRARSGLVLVDIPGRNVNVTPMVGRVGTLAVVRGTGFPSKNDEGSSFNVQIVYDANNGNSTTVSAMPDASGRFEAQLRIPTTASIPSSNSIKVSFADADGVVLVTTVAHDVPEGIIMLSSTSGGPGSSVTVNGEGFKSFVPVSEVKVGTLEVTPSPKPNTDANGMVEFDITIPGLDVGIQTIEVTVGKTTASTGFTVTESGIAPGDIKPVAEAIEDVGDNLVSVWHFNNDTKVWAFYSPELAEGNTLTHMVTGETYLIQVSSSQEVILNRDTRSLTCVGGNCWNQIVW